MYLGGSGDRDDQLRTLEILIAGYELALDVHSVDEPGRHLSARFAAFVAKQMNWSVSCGVVAAILERMHGEEAWNTYWNLVDAFRKNV